LAVEDTAELLDPKRNYRVQVFRNTSVGKIASNNGAVTLKNRPFPSLCLPIRCGSASQEESQGTRYYLHSIFFILFILHIVNASIRHYSIRYIGFLSYLYGPILFLFVLLSKWAQDFSTKNYFQVDEKEHNAVF
jgi:NADH:ubiquinone oxidoreductase subunit 3 (subunit A)